MLQLIKEPLLHFFLIGLIIFGLYGLYASEESLDHNRRITITSGEIEWLAESWKKRWNRPPTQQELDGLIREYTRELVLYREALAMGLDKEDTIVRRRMAQKLEFLSRDLVTPKDPSEQELKDWFEAHSENYTDPDLYTMTQIFLDPDKRDTEALKDAEAIRDTLNANAKIPENLAEYGDPFMLPQHYPDSPESELAKLFGSEFAQSVIALEPGRWVGPILSGYGVHVVYLHGRRVTPPPELAQVREQVHKDWVESKHEELNDQFIKGLLSRYEIIIEQTTIPIVPSGMTEAKP